MSSSPPRFSDLFPNYDADAQLRAVHDAIETIATARNDLHGRISEAEHDLRTAEGYPDDLIAEAKTNDLYYESVYRDAVVVQTVISTLSPMVEGFLVHAFEYLRVLHGDSSAPTKHNRWARSQDAFWNPRKGGGLIDNLKELRDALTLEAWLTDDRIETLELLFFFRNKSLHFAFEWPADEMKKFEAHVSKRIWDRWVQYTRVNEEPWMAYLTDSFLSQAEITVRELFAGFSAVAKSRGGAY